MILYAERIVQEDKQLLHRFYLDSGEPTTAHVSWSQEHDIPGTDKKETITTSVDFPVTLDENGFYTFTAYIPANTYTVQLNTEDHGKTFDSEFIGDRLDDVAMRYFWTGDPQILLPACDSNQINIELFSPDGKQWDVQGVSAYSRKFWNKVGTVILDVDDRPIQLSMFTFYITYVREEGSTWVNFNDIDSMYCKVTYVKPVLSDPLLSAILVNEQDYKVSTYGRMMYRS